MYEDLDENEQEFHRRFHTDELKQEMIAADQEYGYGLGAPEAASIEQVAHLAYSAT